MHDKALRWTFGLSGSVLALLYPFAFFSGGILRDQYRCRDRVSVGTFDDCFNDYLPLLELSWMAISLILALIFIRLSFRVWAGNGEGGWRWAWGKQPDYESTEVFRRWGLLVGLGLSAYQLLRLPLNLDWLHWAHVYWMLFALWFALSYWKNSEPLT